MEELRQQVIILQRQIHDLMDSPNDPAARHLAMEVQGLEDDLQVKKNPGTIADRVKRIVHLLEGEAKASRIMNYEHLDMFRRRFEHIEEQLR